MQFLANRAPRIRILADAALETTVLSARWFIVAWLTQDTGFVARAQGYLDDVVGRDRPPNSGDRARLPYIDAIVEEILRWRPIGTTGVPHLNKVEDQYEGFRIPAGSIVFANQWAITREAEVFGEDASDFVPERWLAGTGKGNGNANGNGKGSGGVTANGEGKERTEDRDSALRDLPTIGFGFGRRVCTGRHIARSELWIQIAMLLWAFNLEGAVSRETGESVKVNPLDMTDSLVIRPMPFNVVLKTRGPWVDEVITKQCGTLDADLVELLDNIGEHRASRQ